MEQQSSELVFWVNGRKVVEKNVDPEWTLLFYLRNKLRLSGTKLGCAEGGCGACTVMISKIDRKLDKIRHMAVNACLFPVVAAHGVAVTTVEGIGSTKTRLHAVQERIAKAHGSQCGFCTPGIVMSMYALLRSHSKPSFEDMEIAFQGNLCRCTGYRPIIEGFRTFVDDVWSTNGSSQDCCRNGSSTGCCKMTNGETNGCCKMMNGNGCDNDENTKLFDTSTFTQFDPSQEPIFPPELKMKSDLDDNFLEFHGSRVKWFRPKSVEEILELKTKYPAAKIVVGNTEIGVEVKFKNFLYPVIIQPSQIDKMNEINITSAGIRVGSSVTLTEMEEALKVEIDRQPEYRTRVFAAVVDMLRWFAGRQIRNVACLGGNLATASPISDLNPILLASRAMIEVASKDQGTRRIPMDGNFFLGYRKTALRPDEVILSITLPYTEEDEFIMAYKAARRREDDIAIVTTAMRVKLTNGLVKEAIFAFGGMAPTSVLADSASKAMVGRLWNDSLLEEVVKQLPNDLPLSPGAPGGMISYRRSLTTSFFFKFYLTVCQQLHKKIEGVPRVPDSFKSATLGYHRDPIKSTQLFDIIPSDQPQIDPVGRPLMHKSALKQATGEAVYVDDMPPVAGELYLALVLSTRPHARILSINDEEALSVPGVHIFLSAKDLTEHRNRTGPILHDEEVFASAKVTCVGQIIGAIVADDQATAQRAAKLVKVNYEDLSPVIITIEDAIKESSYYDPFIRTVRRGNVDAALVDAEHVLEGEVRIGGQEHFYLETHATIAVPKEDNELELFSSTQNPSEVQKVVAEALGIPLNRVVCHVKRMGGGFGGKETRGNILAIPVALAAQRLNRPVRCMLDRDEDMMATGMRHPFLGRYRVGFSSNGRISALDLDIYNNAGNSLDLSASIMERALFHMTNASIVPHLRGTGRCCRTNLPSNTAFRGFGGPQGMFVFESIVSDVALFLNKDPSTIHELNMYKEGDITHYNQVLERCTLNKCWEECIEMADYKYRKQQVDNFNREHRWKKRGLAVIPTMFGIAFTATFLNQSGALVHVYTDGSVLLTHGGTEMGQGLHTKMIQVASRVLGIPSTHIHIAETSTDKVPNTPATAASAGSDLNGMAVLNACQVITERLDPYKSANPKGSWEDWVQAAYFDRVSLSATGFYRTPDLGYSFETNSGNPFNYFCFGAACTEVEIDCLTGEHMVLRTDLVMDVGESLNPAIDIGQVEGGFVQGYGLFTLEEHTYSPQGVLFSRGPGAYKLPGFADIPVEFNVALLRGAPNPRAVFSSKAVGEPPLFLSSSAFFAIKDAISAARESAGISGPFRLDSPATSARIRMACPDKFSQMFPEASPGSYKPWNVVP